MQSLVFLLDVDNTLLDNDAVKADLEVRIGRLLGEARSRDFWAIYEQVRRDYDYVDFPRTLARFRMAFPDERGFPHVAALVLGYPYETALFPLALEVIAYLRTMGTAAILSDGDPVFQPAKIARAGLASAVDDEVLVVAHKEQYLDNVMKRLPAERYVMVDDKPGLLAAMKARLAERVVTVHICQGRYAHEAEHAAYPEWDLGVEQIADLLALGAEEFTPREHTAHG
ncbi:MAG: hypothetical protein QOF51_3014 [Chloroflexota bacterium]|jgi:FMN phosphatase YigB (HAD superfamily)|nr:hypothetical protein [Chloroflexota bacterium]